MFPQLLPPPRPSSFLCLAVAPLSVVPSPRGCVPSALAERPLPSQRLCTETPGRLSPWGQSIHSVDLSLLEFYTNGALAGCAVCLASFTLYNYLEIYS